MSKLGYAVKRAMKMDWKKMRQTADMLHEKTGKSRAWLRNITALTPAFSSLRVK